jgi:DNA polymerase-1
VQRYQEGMTKAQAKSLIRTFHDNFPAVRALQDMTIAVHKRRGYIKSLGGRRLHMEEYGEHKLLNKLIQGSAADVMKQGLINVYRAGFGIAPEFFGVNWLPEPGEYATHMISVVHDDIWFDGPVDELEWLHEKVPPLMDAFPEVSEVVPIIVGHEVSTTNWADKIDYDEWVAQTQEVAA